MSTDSYPHVKKLAGMLTGIGSMFAESDMRHLGHVSLETMQINASASVLKSFDNVPVTRIDTESSDSNINNILTECMELFMPIDKTSEVDEEGYVVCRSFTKKERQGRMLLGLRLREGLTRKQVANAIGSNELYIRQYESCARRIHPGKIPLLAKLLNTTIDSF